MKKTLFSDPNFFVMIFKKLFKFDLSIEFISVADEQLSSQFENITGIIVNNARTSFIYPEENTFKFISGGLSQLNFRLCINHNWNDCPIVWRSKSGRIYLPNETTIDAADIIFSFKHIDVSLIRQQMYPKDTLPFKLNDPPFELIVERINKDCIIEMECDSTGLLNENILQLQKDINSFISEFNTLSEKKDRRFGVVYNWDSRVEDAIVSWNIDLGSTGYYFLKQLLQDITKLRFLKKVTII